jgi:hypothetical protein
MEMLQTTEAKLDAVIAEHGGERVTPVGRSVEEKITVRCSKGHTWQVKPSSLIYNGTWCQQCETDRRRLGLEKIKEIGQSRGGECLSSHYSHREEKLDFRCKEGHHFSMTARMVKSGSWCPECRKAEQPKEKQSLADAIRKAEELGGRHVGHAKRLTEKTHWECEHGHRFEATGKSLLLRKYFCPVCAGVTKTTLETVQEECEKRGGRCLSEVYEGPKALMRFECNEGHQWDARWKNVKAGSWCPVCARKRKDLKPLHAIARKYGGKLLSKECIDNDFRYAWQCGNGHVFVATAAEARERWCPDCLDETPHERVARVNRGECLDEENGLWRCEYGHEFQATITKAALAWCPTCLSEKRG